MAVICANWIEFSVILAVVEHCIDRGKLSHDTRPTDTRVFLPMCGELQYNIINVAIEPRETFTCILSCLAPSERIRRANNARYDAQTYVRPSKVLFLWRIETRSIAGLTRPTFFSYRRHGCIHSMHNGSTPPWLLQLTPFGCLSQT